MSTFNILSTVLKNRDALPKVLTDNQISGGNIQESTGWVWAGATSGAIDAAGSTYRMCTVPSNARLTALEWWGGAVGSSARMDVAAWYPTFVALGGGNFLSSAFNSTLISSSTYGTAIAMFDTAQLFTNAFPTAFTPNLGEVPLWQQLGLTSDPEMNLDLGFSVNTATVKQGYVGMKARYVL